MAKFRKIDPRIWNDAKFREISDHGKLAFLFLLTHPHMTSLGAMRATIPGLAAELGWSEKAFREAFQEASAKGMANHDEKAALVWLPKFIKYNQPENPNVLKAWGGAVDLLPECGLKSHILHSVKAFVKGLPEAFQKALPEAFAKGMPNPEPEPEPEQEPKPELKLSASRTGNGKPSEDDGAVDRIFEHWQTTYNHPRAALDAKRRKLIRARLKDYSEAVLCQAITGFQNSPYHMGTDPKSNGTVYDSIELYLRDSQHVDMGLRFYERPPDSSLSSLTRRNVAATEGWVPPEMRKAHGT